MRPLAIEWLRARHADAVIVPELSVADWGGASLDVAAITRTHIVGVEIKGDGDSPHRLDRQALAYGMVAREMWLLPAPSLLSRCWKHKPDGWGVLEVWQGRVRAYNLHTAATGEWRPAKGGLGRVMITDRSEAEYRPHEARIGGHLCPRMILGTLWRDELWAVAGRCGVLVRGRATVQMLTDALEREVPAPKLHDEMVAALRRRVWKAPKSRQVMHPTEILEPAT